MSQPHQKALLYAEASLLFQNVMCFALNMLNSKKNHHLNPSGLFMLRLSFKSRDLAYFHISIIIATHQRSCQVRSVLEQFMQSCQSPALPLNHDRKTTRCCGTNWELRGEL